jgi:serine O-acetyltransferase
MSRIVVIIYNFILVLHDIGIPFLPKILNIIFVRLLFSCQISLGAKIGKNTSLGYGGLGVVIHERAIIGNNVIIGSGVTIGGTSHHHKVPIIGDNCLISPGAKILGPITIGNNCVIGANAVVIRDVSDNTLVAGVPAKIIKSNIKVSDYV